MRSEGRDPHRPILTQRVQDLHPQWRRDRTNAVIEPPPQRVCVEPDRDYVGDPLRRGNLADNQVRAATRHQPVDLTCDQRRHLGFPAESAAVLIADGGAL